MGNEIVLSEIKPENVHLPRRRPDSHKGDYGRVLIIGGSVGFTGAPVLSARAASKTGAGLIYVGVPKAIYDIATVKLDEEMPFPLPDEDGMIAGSAACQILRRAGQCDICLIGPGLGQSDELTGLVRTMISTAGVPLVIDADGLNAIANDIQMLRHASCPVILTPHPGEFARLDCTFSQAQRVRAASEFAQTYKCILVLKGHGTVTALPDGSCIVNTTGGPAMAKGGSGDVLAGMIASLAAQQCTGALGAFTIADAVTAAVYYHGLAGDLCAGALGEYSVTAGDLINKIPDALKTRANGLQEPEHDL